MLKRITIKDIAEATGFSPNTVSRALNDKPEIRPQTKTAILEAAARLGYRPNKVAKGLRLNQRGIVGVVVADVANPFFAALVKGIEKAARDRGYSIILQDTDEKYEREEQAIQVLLSEQVDGLLITPVQSQKGSIEEILRLQLPLVLVGRYFNDLQTDYVVPNDEQGGYVATAHLLECGFRRIAMINGPLHISSARERFEGYLRAFKEHGKKPNPQWIREGAITAEDGYSVGCALLQDHPRPTAIVAYSDFVAFGIARAIREAGLKIPADVALVGFDDTKLASCLTVPLTTVRSPIQGMGERAMECLAEKMSRGPLEVRYREKLPMSLIVRESTKLRE